MNIGDKAPEILGKDENGKEIRLSDFQGRKLILYFYPKDNTSGCTAEACSLRDHHQELQQAGYEIVGVSKDSAASHVKFKEKYELPFPLIADIDHTLLEAMGAWGEKSMYGKKTMGTIRTTFIINESGVIEQIFARADLRWQASQNQRARRADSGESLNHVFVPSAKPTKKSRNIWQSRDFCLFLQANYIRAKMQTQQEHTDGWWICLGVIVVVFIALLLLSEM